MTRGETRVLPFIPNTTRDRHEDHRFRSDSRRHRLRGCGGQILPRPARGLFQLRGGGVRRVRVRLRRARREDALLRRRNDPRQVPPGEDRRPVDHLGRVARRAAPARVGPGCVQGVGHPDRRDGPAKQGRRAGGQRERCRGRAVRSEGRQVGQDGRPARPPVESRRRRRRRHALRLRRLADERCGKEVGLVRPRPEARPRERRREVGNGEAAVHPAGPDRDAAGPARSTSLAASTPGPA